MFTLESLNAIATAAAAKVAARANKPARQPRKPGLHSRFLADLLATAGAGAVSVPLSGAVDAWIAHQRETGGDLGEGATPDASISARLYCDAKAGKLPARVSLQAGRPAMIVVASADTPAPAAPIEGVEGVDYDIVNPTPAAVEALTNEARRQRTRRH